MSSAIAKKLLVKPGSKLLVLGAPDAIDLTPLPEGTQLATTAKPAAFDVVLAFARDTKGVAAIAKKAIAATREGGALWVAYPKKSAGTKTDLSRDEGWGAMTSAGWEGVSLVAIDATWSAMRWKAIPAGSKPRPRPATPAKRGAPREVEVPPVLAKRIAKSAKAKATWEGLAYSHKKEYARWITDAKKDETRERRLAKAIAMLEEGKRPS